VKYLLALVVPTVGGAALSGVLMLGLIHVQTAAPSTNPADHSALVYGQ